MTGNTSFLAARVSRTQFAQEKMAWAKDWTKKAWAQGKDPKVTDINRAVTHAFGQGLFSAALYTNLKAWKAERLSNASGIESRPSTAESAFGVIIAAMKAAGIERILVTPDGKGNFSVDAEVRTTTTERVSKVVDDH